MTRGSGSLRAKCEIRSVSMDAHNLGPYIKAPSLGTVRKNIKFFKQEDGVITVEVLRAAAAGARIIEVRFDEESNTTSCAKSARRGRERHD
jgi:hypothetical protein